MKEKDRTEFRVVVTGSSLPEDVVERLNRALQSATLVELAALDLQERELVFRPLLADMLASGDPGGGGGGGGGGGAQIAIARRAAPA